jgi:spore coat polysaccharide biosynthesis protein SpsF
MLPNPPPKFAPQRFVAVVPARLSSQRLPGKVLRSLHRRPVLAHVVDRLRSVQRIDAIVIATSAETADDPTAAFAESTGAMCWRGSLSDVLGRTRDAAIANEADAIVRVSGDSPLIDPQLIRTAIELFSEGGAELVTNVFPRSFPKGQSVEVLSKAILERLVVEASEADDREHVTRYAYMHPERYRIRNFSAKNPRPELQLSVDTLADLHQANALVAVCGDTGRFPTVDQLISVADELALTR